MLKLELELDEKKIAVLLAKAYHVGWAAINYTLDKKSVEAIIKHYVSVYGLPGLHNCGWAFDPDTPEVNEWARAQVARHQW